ncbi:MAG: hypothetical protein HZB46_00640 [Solirubrobacterales bacterium]|nr:hypothetical protein [Solirubrobacterales bacterium]
MQTQVTTSAKLRLVEVPSPSPQERAAGDGRTIIDADVDEALLESFPASDPPQWWAGPPRA